MTVVSRTLDRLRPYVGVAGLVVVGLVAAFVRERFVANRFGASAIVDGYLLSLALCTFVSGLVSGSLSYALIPRIAAQPASQGEPLVRVTLGIGLAAASGVGLVMLLTRRFVVDAITGGATAEVRSAMNVAYPWSLLTIVVATYTGIVGGALNARERFGFPAAAPLIRHGVFLAVMMMFGTGRRTASALAAAALTAALSESALIALAAWQGKVPLLPRLGRLTIEVRALLREAGHVALSSLVMGSTLTVDQYMASWHGEGAVSELAFGSRPTAALLTVAGMSVGTVVLPRLARVIGAKGDVARAAHRVALPLGLGGFLVAAGLWVAGGPVIRLIYGGTSLSPESFAHVVVVHQLFALQIPTYLANMVYSKVLLAQKRARVLLAVGIGCALTNVGLNAILGAWLGVPGIALSTTIVYAVAALSTAFLARRPVADAKLT